MKDEGVHDDDDGPDGDRVASAATPADVTAVEAGDSRIPVQLLVQGVVPEARVTGDLHPFLAIPVIVVRHAEPSRTVDVLQGGENRDGIDDAEDRCDPRKDDHRRRQALDVAAGAAAPVRYASEDDGRDAKPWNAEVEDTKDDEEGANAPVVAACHRLVAAIPGIELVDGRFFGLAGVRFTATCEL